MPVAKELTLSTLLPCGAGLTFLDLSAAALHGVSRAVTGPILLELLSSEGESERPTS